MAMKMSRLALLVPWMAFIPVAAADKPVAGRMNFLLITADDLNADSVGAFGSKLQGTTPNTDRLAAQGMRFERAHLVVANCMPSRNALWSGLYPHTTRVDGFEQVRDAKHLHLADLMKSAGYFTAIQHKVSHSTPYVPYAAWDLNLDTAPDGTKRDARKPKDYGEAVRQAIKAAGDANKPFCLVINVVDPHKPFFGDGAIGENVPAANLPSRIFKPAEVPVPGFLFDDPVVRRELARYDSSVRRGDDSVGEILAALDASGQRDKTVIVFLSDNGMPLPFAKTQLYHHSTRTPLVFVVPGTTKAGSIDRRHMVSAVDVLPTLLEIAGIRHPGTMQGRSFAPLLGGGSQDGRDHVFKEHNRNAGGARDPMRAVQTARHLYIFNAWSDGKRTMSTATLGTPTYRRMAELAKTDPVIGARHKLFRHRVPEELYDVEKDPDCLHNLIGAPELREELSRLRGLLEAWMEETKDPLLEVFRKRDDAAFRAAFIGRLEEQGSATNKAKKKANKQAKKNQTATEP